MNEVSQAHRVAAIRKAGSGMPMAYERPERLGRDISSLSTTGSSSTASRAFLSSEASPLAPVASRRFFRVRYRSFSFSLLGFRARVFAVDAFDIRVARMDVAELLQAVGDTLDERVAGVLVGSIAVGEAAGPGAVDELVAR